MSKKLLEQANNWRTPILVALAFIVFVGVVLTLIRFVNSLWMPVTLGGVFGGLLFAMRANSLQLPRIEDGKLLAVGCIADCAYGLAGGLLIFLLLPPIATAGDVLWLIKIFALAVLGGFVGRAALAKY